MVLKKKKTDETPPKKEDVVEPKTREKKPPRQPAEGSRFGALVLLFVCVLVSLGFYLWGNMHATSLQLDFGKSSSTWEYKK